MVKAIAPPAPSGASFMSAFIMRKKTCELVSITWWTTLPSSPRCVMA